MDLKAWEEDAARCEALIVSIDADMPWLRANVMVNAFLFDEAGFQARLDMG
jgi:hypothetical protein